MGIEVATQQEHEDVFELEAAPARPITVAPPAAIAHRAEPVDAAASLLQVISAAASNPQVDIEKMERLMAMHERMTARTAEAAFNDAMAAAQAEMTPISRDAVNPQTKSRYATYAQLDAALRPVYTKHGFSISFNTGADAPEGHLRLLALVGRGGHTRTYMLDMPSDGKGAKGGDVMTKTHATGAASTYGQRYLLKLIFNVAVGELDNDGNGATGGSSGPGPITEKIFNGLMADLKATMTDAAAAALWASGSKTLAATECREAYAEFKDAVIAHRRALKGATK
jgi:hypothetical protein